MVTYSLFADKNILPSIFKLAGGIRWWDFTFNEKDFEKQYREELLSTSLLYIRFALVAIMIFSIILHVSDVINEQTYIADIAGMRFLLHLPLTLIALILTFSDYFVDLWQFIISIWCLITGIIVLFVYFLSDGLSYQLYHALFLVFIIIVFVGFRIRIAYSVVIAAILVATYFLVGLVMPHPAKLSLLSRIVIITVSVATGIITGAGLEIMQRKYMLSRFKTIQRNEQSRERNRELQEMINHRSSSLQIAELHAAQSDELKTAFLNNLSHHIRTPLNAILGFSYILEDYRTDDAKFSHSLKVIHENGEHILDLVNDLIDLSELETKQLKILPIQCDLLSLKSEAERMVVEKISKSGKKLNFTCQVFGSNLTFKADTERIKQIVKYLAANSITFSDRGMIEASFTIEDSQLAFSIKDQGRGIKKEMQKNVFNSFNNSEVHLVTEGKGLGLGLPLVAKLVKAMNGEIILNSKEGEGCEFIVKIPVEFSDEMLISPLNIVVDKPDYIGRKILVAEDLDDNFLFIETVLKMCGALVLRAKDGLETIEFAKKNDDIDVILMDIRMPNMSGIDATKAIRSFNQHIPIIALSAFAMSSEIEQCKKAGCNDYLIKPVKTNELYNVMQRNLRKLKSDLV